MIKLFINIESNDTNNQSVGFRTSLLISFLHNLTSKKANPPSFLGSSLSLSFHGGLSSKPSPSKTAQRYYSTFHRFF
jgi:hypothetical protein